MATEKRILIIGGSDPDGQKDAVKCDILTTEGHLQKKHYVPNLPKSARYIAVVSNKESVYVICAKKDVYKLSTSKMVWSRCQSMPKSCYFHTATMYKDYIVVIDGDSNAVLIYAIKTDTWRNGPRLPITSGIRKAAVITYNGKIVLSGGLEKVKPLGEVPIDSVWSLNPFPSERQWTPMPPMVKPRHSHTMACVHGYLYIIGGNESPCDIEVYLPTRGFVLSSTLKLPIGKHQTTAVVQDDKILLLPGLSTSRDEDTNHELPGQWVDDSMVTITPNSNDPATGTVTMETLPIDKTYPNGSHAVSITVPQNPTETLYSLLAKLEHLPPTMCDAEKQRILDSLDYHLKQPFDILLAENNVAGSMKSFIQQVMLIVSEAILTGVSMDLMTQVADTLVQYFKSAVPEMSYSMVAKTFLDYRPTTSFADRYLLFAEYLLQREAEVSPHSLWSVIKSEKKNHIPQANALMTNTFQYLRLLKCCYKLVRENAMHCCKTLSVRKCQFHGKLKKLLLKISEMNLNCSTLKLIKDVSEDPLFHDFCTNLGLDQNAMDTCHHLKALQGQICHVVWEHQTLSCLKCHRKDMDCHNADLRYLNILKGLCHTSADSCSMDEISRTHIEEGIVKMFKGISKYFSQTGFSLLEFEVKIIGSVVEGTKVGRFDEFDVQFHFNKLSENIKGTQISYHGNANVSLEGKISKYGKLDPQMFGQHLDLKMREALRAGCISWSLLPFRVIATSHPWQLLYTAKDQFYGMHIFIDLIPILNVSSNIKYDHGEHNNYHPEKMTDRAAEILIEPPTHNIQLWLKWGKPEERHRWQCTISQTERDVMLCLPGYARDGFKLVKLLLEIDYWENGGHYSGTQRLITTYQVKNALLWILHKDIENGTIQKLKYTTQQINGNSSHLSDSSRPSAAASDFAIRLIRHLRADAGERLSMKSFLIPNLFLYKKSYMAGIVAKCDQMLDVLIEDQVTHF